MDAELQALRGRLQAAQEGQEEAFSELREALRQARAEAAALSYRPDVGEAVGRDFRTVRVGFGAVSGVFPGFSRVLREFHGRFGPEDAHTMGYDGSHAGGFGPEDGGPCCMVEKDVGSKKIFVRESKGNDGNP